jgi:flagellar hook-associated protein 2
VFTASASSSAVEGSFDVVVERLAASHKLASTGYSGSDAVVGNGTLTLAVGGVSFSVTIDDDNHTLAGVRDAINEASGNTGVAATVIHVDNGLGGTVSRLVLTSRETGSEGPITVSVVDDDGNHTDALGLSALAYDPDAGTPVTHLNELRAARDALIYIDGEAVTRSSNTVSDAIEGVTLTLKGVSETDALGDPVPASLSVAVDTSRAQALIQGFVQAYNGVVTAIGQVASYNAATGRATALFGSSTVRSLQASLRAELTRPLAGAPAGLSTLTALGITTGADGKLTIDPAKLGEALAGGLDSVSQLFAGEGGLAGRLGDRVSAYTDSDGLIQASTDGLSARIKDLTSQREVLDRRMESLESRLMRQFTALDELVTRLQSSGTFLTQQLASLPSYSSN